MKHNKIILYILTTILLLTSLSLPIFATETASEKAPLPEIEGTAALLLELNSNEVLFEMNSDATVYPASMTKIMTCLLTLEKGTLSDTVTVSETALAGLDEAGSSIGLEVGESMTLENLLYSMMLSSANESCNVAAEYVSGSIDAFVQLMNTRAAQLGCTGTHFANTHGLHNEDHYTTAKDLSLIAKEAMKNNTFRKIVSTSSYQMPATNLSETRKLTTTNQLIIPRENNIYYDKRVTGIKTGFTTPAGRCLIASAEDGPISLLSVVCGCETRVLETGDLEFASFPETAKLLDYGFTNFTYQTVLTTLYPITEIPVSRSAGANFVSLAPKSEITALLPADYNPEKIEVIPTLISDEGVSAPVAAGAELGSVTLSYEGKKLGTVPLVAITDVERATFFDMINPTRYTTQTWLRILLVGIILVCLIAAILLLIRKQAQKRIKKQQRKMRQMQKNTKDNFGSADWFERK